MNTKPKNVTPKHEETIWCRNHTIIQQIVFLKIYQLKKQTKQNIYN